MLFHRRSFSFFYLALKWQPDRHLPWAISMLCLSIWNPDWTLGPAWWSAISLNTVSSSVNLESCYFAPPPLDWTESSRCQGTQAYVRVTTPFCPLFFLPLLSAWRHFTLGEWSDNNRRAEARAVRVKRVLGSNGGGCLLSRTHRLGRFIEIPLKGCGERFHCRLPFVCLTLTRGSL